MNAVETSCRAVRTFDKPGKRLVALLISLILFWPLKHDFFSDKILEGVTNIFTCLCRSQPEGFCIVRYGNLALTVVEVIATGGFRSADLVNKTDRAFVSDRETNCRRPPSVHLTVRCADPLFLVYLPGIFQWSSGISCYGVVTGLKVVTPLVACQ